MNIKKINLQNGTEIKWWEEYLLWPIERIWDRITDIPKEIKWFIQRGKRGYADCDIWGLDSHLASWMPEAIRDLAGLKNSYPSGRGMTAKKWEKELEEMAKGFEAVRKQDELFFDKKWSFKKYKKKSEALEKVRTKGMELFVKRFHDLWD